MSFTYGFYNSLNHDRVYDATTMGQLFDGLINDGVYDSIGEKFMVTAAEGMRVNVGSGRAWFNRTWSFNDTVYPIEDEAAEVVLDRIDALVLDINTNVEYRENQIMFVKGTPSSNPVKPTLINADGHYQYPLAYITVPASSTEIIQDNIENAVGTSECPFANGLLQHVTTDELIVQWQAQWNTWTSEQQTAFINWMNSEEANFADWSSEQQEAFATWMSSEQADFIDWFEHLQDILDEDVAAHLQAEIDEINAEGLLGSIITITTPEPTLIGKTVSITGAKTTKTATFDSEGVAVIRAFEDVGTLTLTSTDNIRTAVASLTVPYYGDYEVTIAFWAATVNITTSNAQFYGETITVEKDGSTVGTCVFNAQGQATYTATEAGDYTFSVTVSGTTYSVSLSVTEETTYNITLDSLGFDYRMWLSAGSVTGTYNSLEDVLSDEKAVRKLMTIHNAVDYLASFDEEDESIETIIKNDLVAKWTTRRAYALDTLSANAYIKSVMDRSDDRLDSLVPKMTSNTAPYGEAGLVNCSTYGTGYPYKAFDGDDSTQFAASSGISGEWAILYYKFNKPIRPYRFDAYSMGVADNDLRVDRYKIVGSNDGSNWDDLTEVINEDLSSHKVHDISTDNSYLYLGIYVMHVTGGYTLANGGFYMKSLQFYGYEEVGAVPKMTSNTTPSGEAFTATTISGYEPYKAFDDNSSTFGSVKNTVDEFIGYEFPNPIVAKALSIFAETSNEPEFYIEGSDSKNGQYTVLGTFSGTGALKSVSINNSTPYKCYRLRVKTTAPSGWQTIGIYTLQFYTGALKTYSKYYYGKWSLMPQVPKMFANTNPYGEASGDGTDPYKAFDQNYNDQWYSSTTTNQGIVYKFTSPVMVKGFKYLANANSAKTVKLQGSNDGTTYVDLTETESYQVTDTTNYTTVDRGIVDTTKNQGYYLYYRLLVLTSWSNSQVRASILQFYAYAPEGNVPIMTSDSNPYGTAFVQNEYQGNYAYLSFGDTYIGVGDAVCNSGAVGAYLYYKFVNPVNVRRIKLFDPPDSMSNQYMQSCKFSYSDDGSTWYDTDTTYTFEFSGAYKIVYLDVADFGYHLYWKVSATAANPYYMRFQHLQFYGRELSESVPKMDTNTTPYGEAFASSFYTTGNEAFRAFDPDSGSWTNNYSAGHYATGQYIGYKFKSPIKATSFIVFPYYRGSTYQGLALKSFKIQASNDDFASEVVDLYETTLSNTSYDNGYYAEFENNNEYESYRLYLTSETYCSGMTRFASIYDLNFFGLNYSEYDWDADHPRHYIYDSGVELESMSIAPNVGTYGEVVKDAFQMILTQTTSATSDSNGARALTDNAIDLTPYSLLRGKLGDRYYKSNTSSINYGGLSVVLNRTDSFKSLAYRNVDLTSPNCQSVDITSVNQNAYAEFACNDYAPSNISITELWLE